MNKLRNKQIYEEASEWLVELRVGEMNAGMRERLDAWFRESPYHIRAFLELSSIWEEGGDPELDRGNSIDALIARARTTPNVVPLERGEGRAREAPWDSVYSPRSNPVRTMQMKMLSWRSVLVASIAIACVSTGIVIVNSFLNPTYATGTGEQRTVGLPDGSKLELNAHSRVRVRFSKQERAVDLVEGQALFRVAKDHARPFVVRSDSTRVSAVGTQFDVYREASGTTVTVVEGQVAVLPASVGTADTAILVAAGEQVTVTPSAVTRTPHADVAAATAWTQHELVFDLTPLTDVAHEFNRYNTRKLVVSGAKLADFHVTGIFSSTDPTSLLRFLRAQHGITVEETDTEIRIATK